MPRSSWDVNNKTGGEAWVCDVITGIVYRHEFVNIKANVGSVANDSLVFTFTYILITLTWYILDNSHNSSYCFLFKRITKTNSVQNTLLAQKLNTLNKPPLASKTSLRRRRLHASYCKYLRMMLLVPVLLLLLIWSEWVNWPVVRHHVNGRRLLMVVGPTAGAESRFATVAGASAAAAVNGTLLPAAAASWYYAHTWARA